MARLAGLPMYDLPSLRAATDAWWQGLAAAFRKVGLAVPPGRSRLAPAALAGAPNLLFTQVCGFDLVAGMPGRLQPVATPCYAAAGCAGPRYCSQLVVHAEQPAADLAGLRGACAAINSHDSFSGCHALAACCAPLGGPAPFFGRVLVTGSHLASLAAVAGGKAALAAIDAVTFALVARHDPARLAALRVLGQTPPAPGLPYVTAIATPAEDLARLRAGLFAALADPALAACREELLLAGAEVLELPGYRRIAELIATGRARAAFPT